MGEDVKRMMADLGLATRDLVSAPEDHGKGNDAHKQAAARQAVASRRAQVMAVTANTKDERAAKLRAWNTESTFEQDGVTSQLEDRFGGQGHRAALESRRNPNGQYNERNEAIDNIVGEERRLYLQEHGGRAPNGRRGPAARDMVNSQGRGRTGAPPSRVPSANAAPYPRAAGIVRFVRDEVVRQTGGDQRPSNNSTAQATATSSAPAVQPPAHALNGGANPVAPSYTTTASYDAAGQQNSTPFEPQQFARRSKAVSIREPSPSSRSNASTSTRSRGSRRRGFKTFNGFQGFDGLRAIKRTTPNTLPALENAGVVGAQQARALWYAATPGEASDAFYEKYPEEKPALEWALKKLIKEIFDHLKKDDQRDIDIYIDTHKERKWMVDVALQAKELIENSTQDEINKYCQAHPEHEGFVVFAASHFTPLLRRDSVMVTEDPEPAKAVASFDENTPADESGNSGNGSADVEMGNTAQENGHYTDTVVAEPERFEHSNGAKQTQAATPGQAFEVANDTPAPKASNRAPKAKTGITNGSSTRADSSPAREANGSSVASGMTQSATLVMEAKGTLAATFYNPSGEFLGIHQMAVQAPVHATMNVTSRAVHFDPLGLIQHIETLAQNMVDRTNGVNGTNGTTGSNGSNGTNGVNGANGGGLVAAYDSDSDEEL